MLKITEKTLLEKGSPKTGRLEELKTLNLSKLGLKCSDLPVQLLSRLRSLERWDLSGNRLQEFPKNLELPELRFLNLNDNQMEDVASMASLCSLEEVEMEDNLYITVSDNYKLMTLLPKLRSYNGKDVTSTANHVRFVFTENLRTRITALWGRSYSLPDPATEDEMATLEQDFVDAARKQVKYGPSSVSDFTRWKVEIMAREFLRSLTEAKDDMSMEDMAKKANEVPSPMKRKQTSALTSSHLSPTPRKKKRSEPAVNEDSRATSKLGPKSRTGATAAVPVSPAAGTKSLLMRTRTSSKEKATCEYWTSPRRVVVNEAKREPEVETSDDGLKSVTETQPPPPRLRPLHVLQCHSKQDDSEDFSTQLWACAFQPQPADSGSRLVATCGGDSLCIIDCEAGTVMKKYKVTGEEFFSLCWSTVLMSGESKDSAQPCGVLAAGGKRGLVKLIHPRCNVAYGQFRASRKALSVLRFSRRQGNFLFTGCYDNKVALWDIGGIDSKYNFKVVQLLVLECSSTPLHISLPPSQLDTQLLAACDDGLHCYNARLGPSGATKRAKEMEVTFPIYEKEDKDLKYHTVDGLGFLTDDIVASKNFMHYCIYLWSWSQTRSRRPNKSGRVPAVMLAELCWARTEIPYLALSTCPGQSYVVCGDNEGKLWTYHVTDLQKNNFQTGKPIEPTEVLQWPAPIRKGLGQVEGPCINSVAVHPDLQYLVALSDKNMVTVWKRMPGAI